MSHAVLFRTPGLIPLEAFTIHGLNVKPNSKNPIGHFGTGLKYAIAVLLRHGLRVRVFIGTREYEFYVKDRDFRGKNFGYVMMRQRTSILKNWFSTTLSYTTQHGKDWELWQAFRELESNTRDEGGSTTLILPQDYEDDMRNYDANNTLIIVEGEAFARVYSEQLDQIFLPINSLELRDKSDRVEIYNKPGKHLYYRGLRVYDLEKPSMYTYNFVGHMDLTEDRTLKYVFEARKQIATHLVKSNDEKIIHEIVGAEEKFFENKVDFDFVYDTPTAAFMSAIKTRRRRGLAVSAGAGSYWSRYSPAPRVPLSKLSLSEQWQSHVDRGSIPAELHQLVEETITALKKAESAVEITGPAEPVAIITEVKVDDNEIPF